MKKLLHRFGKFYSKVIINFIGIFIFVGILSVVFGDYGWLPNENIYAISQFVYKTVIPIVIAYAGGNQAGHSGEGKGSSQLQAGGAIAVMAVSGMILADGENGILGAMILGPLSGMLWKYVLEPGLKKVKTGLEMLVRNVTAALAGGVMALLAFYLIAPTISVCADTLLLGVNYLIGHKLIWLVSFVIEPAKVFFLNNSINHGILIPIGMQQAEQMGESILFLLETNPGPGLGILAALYLEKREKRKEYAASMFVELVGGIHEIYFPEVISNMWLLLALISGGAAGNFCFLVLQGATTGVVSPGSIFAVLLVCAQNRVFAVLIGIAVSAAVSTAVGVLILKYQQKALKKSEKEAFRESGACLETEPIVQPETDQTVQPEIESKVEKKVIQKIGFVCNAGVGSSAMGAALFRRKLREMNLAEVEVEAYAADQMPEDLDAVVCQKDLKEILLSELKTVKLYTVESLLNQAEYTAIIEKIQKGYADISYEDVIGGEKGI